MADQLQFDFTARRGPPARDELPCDPRERGYERFRAEHAAALRQMEVRFGVVLNRRVRLTLTGIPGDFEGRLVPDQLLYPSKRGEPLRLRIGPAAFDYTDIESCVVLD